MSPFRLIVRNVVYHRRSHLPALLSVALATMVMAGALLVGHSVRTSLADAALRRLGGIGQALTSPAPFRADLARSVQGSAAALILDGVAESEDGVAIPNVQVVGCDAGFGRVFGDTIGPMSRRSAFVNAPLASDLGLKVGSELILRVRRPSASAAALFEGRSRRDAYASMRVEVARILPRAGIGEFSLVQQTSARRTLFIDREWLAERLGAVGIANVLLAASNQNGKELNRMVGQSVSLADLGLTIRQGRSRKLAVVSASRILVDPDVANAVKHAAQAMGLDSEPLSVNLALSVRNARTGRSVSYATVAALDSLPSALPESGAAPTPWLADALGARQSDELTLEALRATPDGRYEPFAFPDRFVVTRTVSDPAFATEPSFAPEVPGVSDAATIGDWRPPFPIDLVRVTRADDAYWDRHRAAPKLFIRREAMARLWEAMGEPKDAITGVVVQPAPSVPAFEASLLQALQERRLVPEFAPVRDLALEASQGSTDFAGLFFGLGLFVVASCVGLAYGVVHHMVERRAAQSGLLLAIGCDPRSVRSWLMWEAGLVALAGSAVGVLLAISYAQGSIRHLGGFWGGRESAVTLSAQIAAAPLLAGFALGTLVGMAAGWAACRSATRRSVLGLLSGWQSGSIRSLRALERQLGRKARLTVLPFVLLTAALMLTAPSLRSALAPVLAALAVLLAALLAGAAALRPGSVTERRLIFRNLAINLRGSALTVLVLACATLVLILAAANVRSAGNFDTASFDLVARTSVPLPVDPSTSAGRARLGFEPDSEALLAQGEIVALLSSPGEDASCVNLSRPRMPRLLGLTVDQQRRLLPDGPLPRPDDASIPAAGDSDTVQWQLHCKLHGVVPYRGPTGRATPLRFERLLRPGLFAGDVLVDAADLRRLFPDARGPSVLLIRTQDAPVAATALRRELSDFGVEVRTAREVVQSIADVQNLYLRAFLALGSLGVALGTLGVALAVARNAEDRRAAHALMLAVGRPRSAIAFELAAEQSVLLAFGLALGGVLAALIPGSSSPVDWLAVAGTLLAAAAFGVVSAVVAAARASRSASIADLRKE